RIGSRPAGAFSMAGTFFHFLFRHPVFPSPPPYSMDVRQNKATQTRGESTMKRRKILAAASSLAVLAALLTGCGAQPQESSVTAGVLTLRVNPEIAIHYNQSGKVVALEGDNQDGREIVETYPDYIGKDCEVVVQELVEEIHAAGYFVEEVEGQPRRVVLELDDDSQEPREGFLEDMSRSAQDALEGLSLGSAVVVEDDGAAVSPSPKASEAP